MTLSNLFLLYLRINIFSFSLPTIIDNISLTINPSEKIGIIGRTGSGINFNI